MSENPSRLTVDQVKDLSTKGEPCFHRFAQSDRVGIVTGQASGCASDPHRSKSSGISRRCRATGGSSSTARDRLKAQAPVWRDFWRSRDSPRRICREDSMPGSGPGARGDTMRPPLPPPGRRRRTRNPRSNPLHPARIRTRPRTTGSTIAVSVAVAGGAGVRLAAVNSRRGSSAATCTTSS